MGYTTELHGSLSIKKPTLAMIKKLKTFLGQDIRDHAEWDHRYSKGKYSDVMTYIDFELTEDMEGIQWDGSEKFYDIVDKVNFLTLNMRKEFPEFELEGEILCQGEKMSDRWILRIENGFAKRVDIVVKGKKVTCPHCDEEFFLEEET